MPLWSIWIIVAVVLMIVELTTTIGIFGSISAGFLVAALLAALGFSLEIQLAGLVIVGVIALFLARHFIPRQGEPAPEQKTNVDALVGQRGVVLEEVSRDGGRIKLAGEEWSARSYADAFPVGEEVVVTRIDGAIAVIEEKVQ